MHPGSTVTMRLPFSDDKAQRWLDLKAKGCYVTLSASQTRRRLHGLGYGIRKVESAGRNRAVIVHTATGQHRRELLGILEDVIESASDGE